MNHFSTDQLREYAFDLLEEAQTAEIAAHLETCAACRKQLQAIEAQFQALEVLKEQPEVSEERLRAVLVGGQKVGKSKVIPYRPIAIMAAAASIALAFMLIRPTGPSDEDVASTTRGDARYTASLAELRAEKPFAPASNIELNVLPERDGVQLTIYNAEDLTLVREKRKLTLKRGWNWLQFMWSNTLIDPTSLELEPVTHANRIEITQLVYPPRLNELARWTIFSEFSGEAEFELTYFTSGLKWNAHYEATLAPDEQTMQLKSFVRVDNGSGEDYENAQTRLVVGKIKIEEKIKALAERHPPYGHPGTFDMEPDLELGSVFGSAVDLGVAERKKILKKRMSEYQLYTIEGRETIPDGWGKRLPNFEAQEIGVTNLYKFEQERWDGKTMRFLSFANTEACQLGDAPLPEGQVRVFGNVVDGASSSVGLGGKASGTAHNEQGFGQRQSPIQNGAGSSVYVGASSLQYIPVGEEVELELGAARKVVVEPKLMRTRTDNFEFDSKGNISGWDEITDWKIEITNTKAIPVKVEMMRWADSNHWKVQSDAAFEKYDATHFRFTESVGAQSKRTLEYELTVQHGTRRK